jgi:hypothetical protein
MTWLGKRNAVAHLVNATEWRAYIRSADAVRTNDATSVALTKIRPVSWKPNIIPC